MKLFTKVISTCAECPNCIPFGGSGFVCQAINKHLGFDEDNLPIPKRCPLREYKEYIL
jgi:hypothetical protein